MKLYYPPDNTSGALRYDRRLFLAGSIEMGIAEQWQDRLIKNMESDYKDYVFYKNLCLFNPRREDWDSSWEQSIENPHFFQQVTWELDNLEKANYIIFYFDKKTMSPVTLMELGLFAKSDKRMLVICPDGFWRKGNVDILCNRYNIPQTSKQDLTKIFNYF